MNCPACSSVLKPIQYEGTELHTCDGCGGEFVGPEALAHVVNTRDAKPAPRTVQPSPRQSQPAAQHRAPKSKKPGGPAAGTTTRGATAGQAPGRSGTPVPGIPGDDPIRKMTCAACASPTTVITYALDTGVSVDRCGVCGGVWLDRDELEHIQSIMDQAQDAASAKRAGAAGALADAKRKSREVGVFHGSRFSFVNAIVNRFLDAA
ncbi:MAG: zf-TFIIB domain-containing protein [Phycisphaerales bacterium]